MSVLSGPLAHCAIHSASTQHRAGPMSVRPWEHWVQGLTETHQAPSKDLLNEWSRQAFDSLGHSI